jgi:hypothetical protein
MNFGLNRRTIFLVGAFETIVLSVTTFFLVANWYPDHFFYLFGVFEKLIAFLAMLALLSPVLSTIFYKSNDESYVNDLSVIFALKIIVLAFGIYFAYSHRPVLLVFSVDRFVVVQAHQINISDVPPGILKLIHSSYSPPVIAAKRVSEQNVRLLLEIMSGGVDIEYRPAQYEKFKFQRDEIFESVCSSVGTDSRGAPDGELQPGPVELPLVYDSNKFAVAIFDCKNAVLQKIVFKDPW